MSPNTVRGVILAGTIIGGMLIDGTVTPPPPPADITPVCWEDEVTVRVEHAPNHPELLGVLGCVPADNLPVSGYRPDGHSAHIWQGGEIVHIP